MNASLDNLLGTASYLDLKEYEEPFELFKAMGHYIGENHSSSILRFLVSDRETHALGTEFLANWSTAIIDELEPEASGFPEASFHHSTAQVEWLTSQDRRLDLLISLKDPNGKAVAWIGVENKHWASEQADQVTHYQEALAKHAQGLPSCILFLTPEGRPPHTGKSNFPACPWLPVSYDTVLQALKETELKTKPDVQFFLASFRNHLAQNLHRFDMVDSYQNIKGKVHKLFQDPQHRKAILLLEKLRPTGHGLLDLLNAKLGWDDSTFEKNPTRNRRVLEAKWFPKSLECEILGTAVSIGYLLSSSNYWEPEVEVRIAVLAWCEGLKGERRKGPILRELTANRPDSATWNQEAWDWDCWAPIWVGEKHQLGALCEQDANALRSLLVHARENTHDWLLGNIERLEADKKLL